MDFKIPIEGLTREIFFQRFLDHPQNFFVDVRDFFSFNSVFVFVFVSEKKTYLKTWISGVSKLEVLLVMVLLLSQLDHFTLRAMNRCVL